ncbi:MAG: tRNA epoxyqueuosine(34) reductase QueG [Pseudomonadota bacterium]
MADKGDHGPKHAATLRRWIDATAPGHGFDAAGVVHAEGHDDLAPRLQAFLTYGHHGTMDWMAAAAERRASPTALWPEARSIIMLAVNYGPETDPLDALALRDRGTLSVYARNRDYHDVIKGRLKTMAAQLLSHARKLGLDGDVKVFVDTAPVMEKPLAHKAGLGWQGKHTNLVSRDFGSWLFLGSIFTTLEIATDASEVDHCGSCRACLDVCPTDAFPAPYRLDARRCISYLTIEHDGPIAEPLRRAMGNRVYGCDDCLAVCPWNKFAKQATEMKLATKPGCEASGSVPLAVHLTEDDAAFRARFAGSPVKRIGWARFLRNCLIAAGNSHDTHLKSAVAAHLEAKDTTLRETAQWAMAELSQPAP